MPTVTYKENGKSYSFEAPDAEQADSTVRMIRAANEADLGEIFPSFVGNSPPFGGMEINPREQQISAMLNFATTGLEQVGIIRNRVPNSSVEFDNEGRVIVDIPLENGDRRRGFVNAPGLSGRDFDQAILGGAMFTPAGRLARAIKFGGRVLTTAARGGMTAAGGMATEAIRQQVTDVLGQDMQEDDSTRWTEILMAGVLGFTGEALGAGVSLIHRAIRNPKYVKGTQLTDDGKDLFRKIGIDPEMVSPQVVEQFKKNANTPTAAAVEAFMQERPDQMVRMALQGSNRLGPAGSSIAPMISELNKRYATALADVESQFQIARTGTKPIMFSEKSVKAISDIVRSDAQQSLGFFKFGAKKSAVEKAADSFEANLKFGKTDAATALQRHAAWRRGISMEIAQGKGGTETVSGLKAVRDSADNVMQYITYRHAINQTRESALMTGEKLNDDLIKTYSGNKIVAQIVDQQMTPVDASKVLLKLGDMGAKESVVDAVKIMKQFFGAKSPEIAGLKSEMVRVLSDQKGEFSREAFKKSFASFMERNGALATALFETEELAAIRQLASNVPGFSLERVLGQIWTIKSGVQGSAVGGALRRLANVQKELIIRDRPIFSDLITTAAMSQSQNLWNVGDAAQQVSNQLVTGLNEAGQQEVEERQEGQLGRPVIPQVDLRDL